MATCASAQAPGAPSVRPLFGMQGQACNRSPLLVVAHARNRKPRKPQKEGEAESEPQAGATTGSARHISNKPPWNNCKGPLRKRARNLRARPAHATQKRATTKRAKGAHGRRAAPRWDRA
eukprot:9281190-Alexandrium_andersonii.AAC.1